MTTHRSLYSLSGLTLGLSLMATPFASAAILAQWDFDDDATGLTSTTTDSIFETTTIGAWTPDGAGETGGLSTGNNNYFVRSNDGTINSTNPTTSDAFTSFTVDVSGLAAGEVLNITNVSWDHSATGNATSSLFSRLFTDVTGLTGTGDSIANQDAFTNNVGGSPNAALGVFAELQALNNGDSIEFRLYYGDNSSNSSVIHRIDNFTLDGTVTTVAIPEPSTALLGSLALLGVFRRRR